VADERHAALFELLNVPFERVRVGGSSKLVAAPLGEVAERILNDWPEARRIFAGPEPNLARPTRPRG
jgi:hypothetical protein